MSHREFVEATAADFERIAEIYSFHTASKKSNMEDGTFTAAQISAWVEKFNDREKLLVLKIDGTIVGWGIIKRYSDRAGYAYACETAVYLADGETGKGYGSFVKKELIRLCKEMKYHHLVAKVFATNEASIEYNIKIGYTIVGRQKEIGFRDGKWVDMIIMQYIIDAD